jgi:hypothetical protein
MSNASGIFTVVFFKYLFSNSLQEIALMMEAVRTSETLLNSYQSTRRYNPEDSHLHFLDYFMYFPAT